MSNVIEVLTIMLLSSAGCAPVQKAPAPPTSQPAPKVSFLGVEDRAFRIVYTADASGSMVPLLDDVRVALRRSIDGLQENQSFNLLMWRLEDSHALDRKDLVSATRDQKARARDFLDRWVADGMTDVMPSLEMAFRQRPDVIFLLTDGEFRDNDRVIKWLREHNADKRVRIHAIDFEHTKVLKQIAEENGGKYKHITEADLDALDAPASSPAGTAPRAD